MTEAAETQRIQKGTSDVLRGITSRLRAAYWMLTDASHADALQNELVYREAGVRALEPQWVAAYRAYDIDECIRIEQEKEAREGGIARTQLELETIQTRIDARDAKRSGRAG